MKTRALFVAFALFATVVVVRVGAIIYQRHKITAFLQQFVSLQLGTATFEDAQRLAAKYPAKSTGVHLHDPCTVQDCSLMFTFDNWVFNHLQRDRSISLAAGVAVKDGRVTGKQAVLSILASSDDRQFMYILFDRSKPEGVKGYGINKQRVDTTGVAHSVEVDLGSNAPDPVRKGAYSFNLACLTNFSGCDSA